MPAESVGPYRILGRLGAGGMGEVFLAEDTRLRRRVALKTLAPALADRADARERLRREARAAAAITHPNIAAIFDVFESDAGTHIVMEYVEGTSLDVLVQGGPLPVRRVLQIGLQLADALATAHARGVVHRDLKPSNVRLTPEGHVKVLDFGLARTLVPEAGGAPGGSDPTGTLTQTSELVGTPAYMAPEQLRGARGDQRSDVYSLGVILFELLTGRRPFSAPTTIELAVETLTRPAPDVRDLRADVPADLAAVVARAMAKSPQDRVSSTHELRTLLEHVYAGQSPTPMSPAGLPIGAGSLAAPVPSPSDLPLPSPLRPPPRPPSSVWQRLGDRVGPRWLWAAVAVLVLVGGTAVFWPRRAGDPAWRSATPRQAPVVAVLPVAAPAHDEELEATAFGIGDVLSANLAEVPGVQVLGRSETVDALDGRRDVQRVLRELAPAYVVDASLERLSAGLRLAVHVVDRQGTVAWQRAFDGRADDPFGLPRRASLELGGAMVGLGAVTQQALDAAAPRFQKPPTTSREAWANYADAARYAERPDVPGNLARAVALLEAAVQKDRSFALAHAALASAYWAQYAETKDPVWPPRAERSSVEALRLQPTRAETRVALAQMYAATGENDKAFDELRRAAELAPDSDTPHRLLGGLYGDLGRYAEAEPALKRAIELRPGYWRNWSYLGYAYYQAGRYEEALPVYRRLIELQPDTARGYQALGTVLQAMGRTSEALAQYERAVRFNPTPGVLSNLGTLYYFEGRFADATDAYRKAVALEPHDVTVHRNLGDAYARLGRVTAARAAYERAVALAREQLDLNPKAADIRSQMALCEAKLGRLDRASHEHAEALALNPNDKDILYHAAVIATLGGRQDEGASLLLRALERGYSVDMARKDPDVAALRARDDVKASLGPGAGPERKQP